VGHFDSTGSLIAPLPNDVGGKRPIYVYSLVVKHPTDGIPPVSLADFILNKHDYKFISSAMDVFFEQ